MSKGTPSARMQTLALCAQDVVKPESEHAPALLAPQRAPWAPQHMSCDCEVHHSCAVQRAREANVEDQKSELKRIGRAISCALRQHGKWHSSRAVNHAVESEFCSGEMHVSSLRPFCSFPQAPIPSARAMFRNSLRRCHER